MANYVIKSISCTIKLDENPDLKVDFTIGIKSDNNKHRKYWQLISNPINRLKLPASSGDWVVFENELHLFPKGLKKSFVALSGVPDNFLNSVTCGKSHNGSGTLFVPPPDKGISYSLWFGCA
jgi:hypothetical protein